MRTCKRKGERDVAQIIDFKVRQDDFGYYVIAYRVVAGVESRYETSTAMARLLNLTPEDLNEFLTNQFNGEAETKNKRIHFADYRVACACRDGLRDLIPKAIATGNLFLPS